MNKKEVTRIGLMSDTHMPERLAKLPESLATVFANVDFILHAGDVGELWVLDEISQIAPVIAVFGNDETEDAQRELPRQQVVTVNGRRILLWHSHFLDRAEEMASRKGDDFYPKLQRSVDRAKSAGAQIAVFGHWHIPLVYEHEGVLVINPGGIASGNYTLRQSLRTVAILEIDQRGKAAYHHVNLDEPNQPCLPPVDLDAGFKQGISQVVRSIITPDLQAVWPEAARMLFRQDPTAFKAILGLLAHPVWAGERPFFSKDELITAVQAYEDLDDELIEQTIALLNR
ncbi:MAG: YfcE family phosphodiesterase [Chloroflexota bacterium]